MQVGALHGDLYYCQRNVSAYSLSAGTSLCHPVPSRAVLGQHRSAGDKQVSLAGVWKEGSACLANAFPKEKLWSLHLWGLVCSLLL